MKVKRFCDDAIVDLEKELMEVYDEDFFCRLMDEESKVTICGTTYGEYEILREMDPVKFRIEWFDYLSATYEEAKEVLKNYGVVYIDGYEYEETFEW